MSIASIWSELAWGTAGRFELSLPPRGVRSTVRAWSQSGFLEPGSYWWHPATAPQMTSASSLAFAVPADGSAGKIDGIRQRELLVRLSPPWSDNAPLVMVDGFPADHAWTGYEENLSGPGRREIVILGTRAGARAELLGFHDGTFRKLDETRLSEPVIVDFHYPTRSGEATFRTARRTCDHLLGRRPQPHRSGESPL